MKSFLVLGSWFFVFALAAPLFAAEPALPPVPAALEPLQAKVTNGWYSYKGGLYLNFQAEQPLSEEQWKAIDGLGVKGVGVGGKAIDDATVARLAKMNLEVLSFNGTPTLTDGCFPHLAKMKSLQRLSMGHMLQKEFTGAGLALLKDLPAFEALTLAGSATGNEATQAIGELTHLKEFNNWHTRQTDPHAPYLLKLTSLTKLKLGRCGDKNVQALTDETLATLAQLKSLEDLSLEEARLTLPAVQQLKALPHLKTLSLRNCLDIPATEMDKLRQQLSGVTIQWTPMTDKDREFLNSVIK